MDLQAKPLPHNIEAEQAVLGSMFFGSDAIMEAAETITQEDFYVNAHKIIYESMVELFVANTPVDIITLKSLLDEKKMTEVIGGKDYLVSLATAVSTSANLASYLEIVRKNSMLRLLIKVAGNVTTKSYEETNSVESILDYAEKEIFSIASRRNTNDFFHVRDILMTSVKNLEDLHKTKGAITGVETSFTDLDKKTAGLQPQDFILVAARPSMGKTAFALNIAQFAAIKRKIPIAIFSLEMSKEQLVNRMISSEAMIDSQKLRVGDLQDDDWAKIVHSVSGLSAAPIYINDTPAISAMEIRAKCRKLKLDKGLGLVVIDYLQLMSGSAGVENRQQEISEISRSLKALARELSVPIVAISQLSRAVEARADKHPMLSDLRESGAIEQDADVVMFLYRDEYYNKETEHPGKAELIIAKQRNGPTGTVYLTWIEKYTKFANSTEIAMHHN
ncbi:MAG: replicative DNA helicase [Defluviitaleaceae bacterium]|nr:replicative DNA helicase [Defluviitaleaceae bacterium]